jgi:hypothetical protein
MSWLTDPYQLAQPPTVEQTEVEIEEPPSNEEIFHESIRHYPDTVGHGFGFHTEVCRFDESGNHTAMADNCPHFNAEDETGKQIQPGWTVQQRR